MRNAHFHPERIAHRGAPRELDENTLEGFLRAVERGADAVELDVHTTRDGAVVIHHDPEIARPGGRPAPIVAMTLDDVRACVLPRGGRVPTLGEVLDALGGQAVVYVEIKGAGAGEPAAEVARAHGHRFAFHSFDHDAVLRLRARWPDFHYGFLFDAGTPRIETLAAGVPVGIRDLWVHRTLVTPRLATAAHTAGRRLIAWTVNDPPEARRFASLGVDGLCSDDVRLLP